MTQTQTSEKADTVTLLIPKFPELPHANTLPSDVAASP